MIKKTGWLFVAVLGLAGCADLNSQDSLFFSPKNVGIAPAEWAQFSEAQKQQVLAGARQVKGPESLIAQAKPQVPPAQLSVQLQGGQVKMPPFDQHYSYQPVQLVLNDNTCKTVVLRQQDGNHNVDLQACYINDVLYLDPSRYKADMQYGLQLPSSPVWLRGYRYPHLSSQGYAGLQNVNVSIKKSLLTQ